MYILQNKEEISSILSNLQTYLARNRFSKDEPTYRD